MGMERKILGVGGGGQTEKNLLCGEGGGYCYFMQPYSEDEINKNVHL